LYNKENKAETKCRLVQQRKYRRKQNAGLYNKENTCLSMVADMVLGMEEVKGREMQERVAKDTYNKARTHITKPGNYRGLWQEHYAIHATLKDMLSFTWL
jgi:hypothetical protein